MRTLPILFVLATLAITAAEGCREPLADDCQAWDLKSDGRYHRAGTAGHTSAQARLLHLYDERVALTES